MARMSRVLRMSSRIVMMRGAIPGHDMAMHGVLHTKRMQGGCRVRVAQDDIQTAVHRSEHEPRGNQRPQAQHGEYPGRRPVADTPVSQVQCAWIHHGHKMP